MSWHDYYYLLEKYNGDLTKASPQELDYAKRWNPNTPEDARRLAEEEWARQDRQRIVIPARGSREGGEGMSEEVEMRDAFDIWQSDRIMELVHLSPYDGAKYGYRLSQETSEAIVNMIWPNAWQVWKAAWHAAKEVPE